MTVITGNEWFINQIVAGDVRQVLSALPDECVQCVVTSPPYWGLRSYLPDGHQDKAAELGAESSPDAYVQNIVGVFSEVRRVLRQDGVMWLNLGDSYASGKGTCFNPGGGETSLGKTQKEAGAHPLNRGNKSELTAVGLKPKDLVGIPWRVALALQSAGWWLRCDCIWEKPNCMPSSVTDRPTRSHEYVFMMTKSAKYYYDHDAVKEPAETLGTRKSTRMPDGQMDNRGVTRVSCAQKMGTPESGMRNRRSVFTIPTHPYPDAHFATFPPALITPLILSSSRPCDLILDPFMGSGTTALVASTLARFYFGTDLNPQYVAMAQARLLRGK